MLAELHPAFAGIHPMYWISRLGESGVLVPVALLIALWMFLSGRHSKRLALAWLMPLAVAAGVTAVSKIAFIGWGVGLASIDFTGFSGHAMFSAAVYPMLAYAVMSGRQAPEGDPWRRRALIAAYGLAFLIAVSRVRLNAHSVSESALGFMLGAAASASALWLVRHVRLERPRRWIFAGLVGWMAVMPTVAAPVPSHDMVTWVALKLANRSEPFRREHLHGLPAPLAERRVPHDA